MRLQNMLLLCLGLSISGCTTSETITRPYMVEAQSMIGMNAKANRKELKHYMNAAKAGPVDPLHIPWCAGWTNAVLQNNGLQGTRQLTARSFLKWGYPTKDPQDGDIVVLRRGRSNWTGHVGFFVGYEDYEGTTYVKVLSGNTDKQVAVGYFPKTYVLAYRSPN